MANEKNLIYGEALSQSKARENGKKGGKASGKARREKADVRRRLKAIMDLEAAPGVASKLEQITGIDVKDNADMVVASIMRGVMKSSPQMIQMFMEYTDQSKKDDQRDRELEIARERLEIEKQKAELEAEKQKLWLEAVKNADKDTQEDDGFIEALSGTVKDDWSDEA